MPTLFQAGTISGLLQGIYDGDIDYKTLAKHGDIGLGTFNGVDGEMVAVDGKFYRINASGKAEIADPDALTPFSVVTKAHPTIQFEIGHISDINTLNDTIDKKIKTHNIFYMIQIDCEVEWIKIRSEACQPRPYKPLAETLPNLQTIYELKQLQGTLVTTRCPAYSSGITIAGYHHHFIDKNRSSGGHVFDLKIMRGTVMITEIRNFTMALIKSDEFDHANLEVDIENMLKKTE